MSASQPKQLHAIAADLWCAETSKKAILGAELPLRMSVFRAPSGKLVLWSPIAIDDALAAELAAIGDVEALVGPNLMHHVFIKKALERYPQAKIYGAPGLAAKRKDLSFAGTLPQDNPFAGVLEVVYTEGAPALSELVALHKPTKTLIVTDLLFNIPTHNSAMSRFVLKYISRAYGGPKQSYLWHLAIKNKAAAAASASTILALDFDRIVMSHGEIIQTGAKPILEDALRWMLGK